MGIIPHSAEEFNVCFTELAVPFGNHSIEAVTPPQHGA
jgi:hypothetical protein